MFNIVLVEPEIPQNTGNIVRTCAATGCRLHLVRPLGFEVSDKYLKRAGLDYWHFVNISYYDSVGEVFEKFPASNFYFFSTKAAQNYAEVRYKEGDFLVFGKETRGLPEDLLAANYDRCVRLPMRRAGRTMPPDRGKAGKTEKNGGESSFPREGKRKQRQTGAEPARCVRRGKPASPHEERGGAVPTSRNNGRRQKAPHLFQGPRPHEGNTACPAR